MCMREKRLSKRERSRLKIMETAVRLFEEKGIHNVTFQDIADGADMCRTTVFNHFSTTSELLNSIYSLAIEITKEKCIVSGKSGLSLITYLFNMLLDETAKYPALITQMTGTAMLYYDKSITVFAEVIEKNLPEKIEDKKAMTTLITGAYFGMLYEYHGGKKEFDAEKMKEEFKNLMDVLMKPYL